MGISKSFLAKMDEAQVKTSAAALVHLYISAVSLLLMQLLLILLLMLLLMLLIKKSRH